MQNIITWRFQKSEAKRLQYKSATLIQVGPPGYFVYVSITC